MKFVGFEVNFKAFLFFFETLTTSIIDIVQFFHVIELDRTLDSLPSVVFGCFLNYFVFLQSRIGYFWVPFWKFFAFNVGHGHLERFYLPISDCVFSSQNLDFAKFELRKSHFLRLGIFCHNRVAVLRQILRLKIKYTISVLKNKVFGAQFFSRSNFKICT